jgi:hypothetical protein
LPFSIFTSETVKPTTGSEKSDRTVGSSIYLRGAGNQVVLINSERGNGRFYEDKAENNDGIPVRCSTLLLYQCQASI